MAITAWTGVAAAPFRSPTLCSLLGIDFASLHREPHRTEQQLGAIRDTFALYFGEISELLTFVIDEASEMPKLVTVDPTPSLSIQKKYRVVANEVVEAESKGKINEYAYPIASGMCDAAWMFAFDALEDDLLERERGDDALMTFTDGAISMI